MTFQRIEAQWTLGPIVFTRTSLLGSGFFKHWWLNETEVTQEWFEARFKEMLDALCANYPRSTETI